MRLISRALLSGIKPPCFSGCRSWDGACGHPGSWYLYIVMTQTNFEIEPSRPRVGVALGGGVARGNFLFGALRALDEAGVRFDCFAGTSSGSIAASALAGGTSHFELGKMTESVKWFQDVFHLKNTTLNVLRAIRSYLSSKGGKDTPPGFLESSRLADFVSRTLEGRTFSQIQELILTATDIVTGEEILFCAPKTAQTLDSSGMLKTAPLPLDAPAWQQGYLRRDVIVPFEDVGLAVRASCCFPGMFSSVLVDCPDLSGNVRKRMLYDGGICEQVPVRPLKALGCEKVLAIFIGFLPRFQEVSHFVAVSLNSVQFIMRSQIVESLRQADYVLYDPHIEDESVVTLDPNLVQKGYEFTRERIPDIKKALGIE